MEFIAGTVHPVTNHRYICAGRATPGLQDLKYIIAGGRSEDYDWGPGASTKALEQMISAICQYYGLKSEVYAERLKQRFLQIPTSKFWILRKEEFDSWLDGWVN